MHYASVNVDADVQNENPLRSVSREGGSRSSQSRGGVNKKNYLKRDSVISHPKQSVDFYGKIRVDERESIGGSSASLDSGKSLQQQR